MLVPDAALRLRYIGFQERAGFIVEYLGYTPAVLAVIDSFREGVLFVRCLVPVIQPHSIGCGLCCLRPTQRAWTSKSILPVKLCSLGLAARRPP